MDIKNLLKNIVQMGLHKSQSPYNINFESNCKHRKLYIFAFIGLNIKQCKDTFFTITMSKKPFQYLLFYLFFLSYTVVKPKFEILPTIYTTVKTRWIF